MQTNRVNEISKNILALLTEFSNQIIEISELNNELLKDSSVNTNDNFLSYIHYFDLGRFYHFRCMGYMECLVMTKCYNVQSLCYWKNSLVMPAYNNITDALGYYEKLSAEVDMESNEVFMALTKVIENMKKTAMEIMQSIKLYKLPC